MAKMTRFGVSLEAGLLKKFDAKIEAIGYRNRSAALRDLVRHFLKEGSELKCKGSVYAVVTIVMKISGEEMKAFSDMKRTLSQLIKSSQVQFGKEDYFLDVSILFGKQSEIKEAAERLMGLRGILSSSVQYYDMLPPCHS
ncbi:ribbon-helix-helix protein, CopG family [bacterium]|nr:ribbon-helix-helix protein, CopG family [bacterium]